MSIALDSEGHKTRQRAKELAAQRRDLRRLVGLMAESAPELYDDDRLDLRRYWSIPLRRSMSLERRYEARSYESERFDYVILGSLPVIGLAGALAFANLARATLFVVEAARTRYGALKTAAKRLRAANAAILDAVTNRFGRRVHSYGYGYGYHYGYYYSYGDRDRRERSLPEPV
jgi:hypothetical protein